MNDEEGIIPLKRFEAALKQNESKRIRISRNDAVIPESRIDDIFKVHKFLGRSTIKVLVKLADELGAPQKHKFVNEAIITLLDSDKINIPEDIHDHADYRDILFENIEMKMLKMAHQRWTTNPNNPSRA